MNGWLALVDWAVLIIAGARASGSSSEGAAECEANSGACTLRRSDVKHHST
jgi:hypothetical protein